MDYAKVFAHIKAVFTRLSENPRVHMDAYAEYEDIAAEHQNFLDVAYWMTQKDRSIEQIPEHARTDRLLFFHLGLKPHRFESITPSSKRYYAICEFGMWKTSEIYKFIPVVFITEPLVRRLSLGDPRHQPLASGLIRNDSKFDNLYTDELVNFNLRVSLSFLCVLSRRKMLERACWGVVKPRLELAPYESHYAIRFGFRKKMKDFMDSGFWFETRSILHYPGVMKFSKNPQNPASVAQQWDEARGAWGCNYFRDNEQIFAVKMDTFPDEIAVPELVTSELGRRFLQKFFSDERVRSQFHVNRAVRGFVLEHELGM